MTPKRVKPTSGFSLIEILVTICIFAIIASFVYLSYSNILDVIGRSRTHTLATSLINKQVEMIRNLAYDNVGIAGGYPVGTLPASTTVAYEGQQFTVYYFVRNIDDSFDGTEGGSPNDTANADYKLVELQVDCTTCFKFVPVVFTTWVAPQNLESNTKNGSLFINVFNASGQAISNANVLVKNTVLSPTVTINDTTNNSGTLQLVDIPTSTTAYQITVSKSGYTTAQTYTASSTNPNPSPGHATVASQQITAISFAIDRISSINVKTQDQFCRAVPAVKLTQNGQKLIGNSPNYLLYSQAFTTDSNGQSSRTGLFWDTYSFINNDTVYELAGSMPLSPLTINPNTNLDLAFLVQPKASTSLMVTAVTAAGLAIPDVTIALTKSGFSSIERTGEQQFTATDWSGSQYASQDGNVSDNTPAGELRLRQIAGSYPTSTNSFVESNSIDFGTSTLSFHALSWTPVNQPLNTSLKLQLAGANTSSGPWNYTGPDGTGGTYYTSTSTLTSQYDNKQFIRYKVFFNTTDPAATPKFQDIALAFASGCTAPGQTVFSGMATGAYTLTLTKAGYTTLVSPVTIGAGWQEIKLTMQ